MILRQKGGEGKDKENKKPTIPINKAVRLKKLLDACETRGIEVELIERSDVKVPENVWVIRQETLHALIERMEDTELKNLTERLLFDLNREYKIVKGPEEYGSGRDGVGGPETD